MIVYPSVTVLIPNYNDEEYIEKSIRSALEQDYEGSLNVCVVDDGSTDGSLDLLRILVKNPASDTYKGLNVTINKDSFGDDRTITLIENKNSGPSGARNVGIGYTIAKTDIYAMLDSDDEMYPNKVSECVKQMEDDFVGAVYGDYDVFHTSTGKMIREFKEPFSRKRLVRECIVHSGSVVSAKALEDVLEETGYYDEEMRTCEDYDLWMRISEKYIIKHIPKSLTMVRVTGDNSSFVVNQEVWQKNWLRVMQKKDSRANGK